MYKLWPESLIFSGTNYSKKMKHIITTAALMLTMIACKTENKTETEPIADNDMAQTSTKQVKTLQWQAAQMLGMP